jgi:hypothetical protein
VDKLCPSRSTKIKQNRTKPEDFSNSCKAFRRLVLFDKQFLTRKDFASGGKLVNAHQAFQGNIMFLGDGVWAVAVLHGIGAHFAGIGKGFGFETRNFEALADVEPVGGQMVQGLDFFTVVP